MTAPQGQDLKDIIALLKEFGALQESFSDDLNVESDLTKIHLALYQCRKQAEELLVSLGYAYESNKLTANQEGILKRILGVIKGKMLTLIAFLEWYRKGEYNQIVLLDKLSITNANNNTSPVVSPSASQLEHAANPATEETASLVVDANATSKKKSDEQTQTLLEQIKKILEGSASSTDAACSETSSVLFKRSTPKKSKLMDRAQILNTVLTTLRRGLNAVVDILTIHIESLRSLNEDKSLDDFLVSLKYAAWIFALIRLSIFVFRALRYTFADNQRSPTEEQYILAPSLLSDQLVRRDWVRNFRDLIWQGRIVECISDDRLLSSQITTALYGSVFIANAYEAWRKKNFCSAYIKKNTNTEDVATNVIIVGIQEFSRKAFFNYFLFSLFWFICLIGATLNLIGNNRSNEQEKIIDTVGSGLIVLSTIFSIIWENLKNNITQLLPKTNQYYAFFSTASPHASALSHSPSPRSSTAVVEVRLGDANPEVDGAPNPAAPTEETTLQTPSISPDPKSGAMSSHEESRSPTPTASDVPAEPVCYNPHPNL